MKFNRSAWGACAFAVLALAGATPPPGEAEDPAFKYFPKVDVSPEVQRALCGDSSRCRVAWWRRAGEDSDGRTLEVIRVARLEPSGKREGVGEVWLVVRKGRSVVDRRLLTRDSRWEHTGMQSIPSNFSPGFQISSNRFREFIRSYEASRGFDITMQLHPFRLLSEAEEVPSAARGPGSGFTSSWNWLTFSGGGENRGVEPCRADEDPSVYWRTGPFLPIPQVSMKPEFLENWKTARLGDCALALGGVNSPGYLLAGWRDETRYDVVMKLLLISDQDLLVEVPRTEFIDSQAGWLLSDHLEIWQEDEDGFASQWGIRLSDGAIFPAHNRPQRTPTVERAKGPAGSNFALLKIHLAYKAAPESYLSVSYSGSLEGREVGLLLSTSRICFGHSDTLSRVKFLGGRGGRCEVESGTLHWNREPEVRSGEPVVDLTLIRFRAIE